MQTIVINQTQVADLLPMAECIQAMDDVFRALTAGDCIQPLRHILWLPEKAGALGTMPSYWHSAGMIGLKAVTFFPANEGTEHDSHQGAVLLYDAKNGRLVALIDGTSITAIRTAAVSGLATQWLAREDAATLAIIGSGVQAGQHLDAMIVARPIKTVRVFSKTPANARFFAATQAKKHSLPVTACESAEAAVTDADIICTTTSSRQPVVLGQWIKPGAHINAAGSSIALARELDALAVQRSRLIVDRRESALNEAGDFLIAKEEGAVTDDHILGELGDLLTGKVAGRTSDDDITLFKSVGLAVEDLAAACHVYRRAIELGIGTSVTLGGTRDSAP